MKRNGQSGTKKSVERPIFDAIRKPLAPPGHTLGHPKPNDRARPAQRKTKHKRRPDALREDD
jgi:hypothetical protein